MGFPYTTGIPNPPDNPSQDVANMQQNDNTIDAWVRVDHIGFNNGSGGEHKQVTFNANIATPALTGGVGLETVNVGVAASASQLFFTNALTTVQLSAIRAWGYVANGVNVPQIQSYNVASSSQAGNNWTVNLVPGATSGPSFVVLASALSPIVGSPNHNAGVTVLSSTTNSFTVATYDAVVGSNGVASGIFFIVLQI